MSPAPTSVHQRLLRKLHGGEYHPIAKSGETDIELTRPFNATIRLA